MNRLHNKKQNTINLSPPSLLALGFLSFILIGTLLLKLPNYRLRIMVNYLGLTPYLPRPLLSRLLVFQW